MNQRLGVLEEIDARSVWPNEARDFTPWLRQNIDILAEVVELDLEVSETEGPVGDFAVDLVGRDLTSGSLVIIENQLSPTDHGHLGQVLTYAAGREAQIVIWIAPQFRDEHRQALVWLNERTREDQAFFGIEVRAVRIAGSVPAPLFTIVAQPNEWQKTGSRSVAIVSPRGEAYRAFWTTYLADLREQAPGLTRASKGLPQNWCGIGAGRSGFSYNAWFGQGDQLRVELYIDTGHEHANNEAFDCLLEQREQIEQELGSEISWERLDNRRASRVALYTPGSIDASGDQLHDLRQWAVSTKIEFAKAFGERVRQLP